MAQPSQPRRAVDPRGPHADGPGVTISWSSSQPLAENWQFECQFGKRVGTWTKAAQWSCTFVPESGGWFGTVGGLQAEVEYCVRVRAKGPGGRKEVGPWSQKSELIAASAGSEAWGGSSGPAIAVEAAESGTPLDGVITAIASRRWEAALDSLRQHVEPSLGEPRAAAPCYFCLAACNRFVPP